MASSRTTDAARPDAELERSDTTLARPLAPEEIGRGQFVTVLDEITEWPSFFWCADAATFPREQPVRLRHLPASGGQPLRVDQVCLPFVLVKQPDGNRRTLDIRKCRIAGLSKDYARAAWKAFKKTASAAPAAGC